MALAQWKQKVYSQWNNVQVLKVTTSTDELKVGSAQEITAVVQLGSLTPDDVIVQVYYGDLDTHGNIVKGNAVNMQPAESNGGGTYTFKAQLVHHTTGNQGISVRILPNHEDLPTPFLRGLIRWA